MTEWLNNPSLAWLFISEEIIFIAVLIGIICFINRLYDCPPPQATISPWVFITLGIGVVFGWYCYLFLPWPTVEGNRLTYMVLGYEGFMGILMIAPDKFFQRRIWYQPLFQQRVLVLTGTGANNHLPPEILAPPRSRYKVVGILNDDPSLKGKKLKGVEVLGSSRELDRIVSRLGVRQVVVAIGQQRGQLPINILLDCRLRGVRVLDMPDFYEQVTGKIQLQNLRPSWLIFNPGFKPSLATVYLKRLLDVLLSSLGLLLGLPCWIVIGFIRIGWGNRVLVTSPRTGEKERLFNMFTFSPEIQQGIVGKVLRVLHMDKLPVLINVLRGEMSLVGPHPDEPELATEYGDLFPYYDKQLRVKPGLLSWAGVNQVNGFGCHDLRERWQYDLYYAKRASLWLDFKIVWRGIKLGGKRISSIAYEEVHSGKARY